MSNPLFNHLPKYTTAKLTYLCCHGKAICTQEEILVVNKVNQMEIN